MPEKKNKKVKFRENNDIHLYSNNKERIEYRKSVPMSHRDKLLECDIDKLKNFPCRYRGITFDNADDVLEYVELKNVNLGLNYDYVVSVLKDTNNYRQYIPKENRLQNLDTGEIYDVSSYINPSVRNTDPRTMPKPKSRIESLKSNFKNAFKIRGGTRKNKKNKSLRRFRV